MADFKEDRDKVSLIDPLKKEVSDPYYGEKKILKFTTQS
tara:strand:+ start:346 stop:462 length:117 start_codon:yes stop_codon:yes gene_type:complete